MSIDIKLLFISVVKSEAHLLAVESLNVAKKLTVKMVSIETNCKDWLCLHK